MSAGKKSIPEWNKNSIRIRVRVVRVVTGGDANVFENPGRTRSISIYRAGMKTRNTIIMRTQLAVSKKQWMGNTCTRSDLIEKLFNALVFDVSGENAAWVVDNIFFQFFVRIVGKTSISSGLDSMNWVLDSAKRKSRFVVGTKLDLSRRIFIRRENDLFACVFRSATVLFCIL